MKQTMKNFEADDTTSSSLPTGEDPPPLQTSGGDDDELNKHHQPSPENGSVPATACDGCMKEPKLDKRGVNQHGMITSDNLPLESAAIATSDAVQDGQHQPVRGPGVFFVPGPDFRNRASRRNQNQTSPIDADVNLIVSDAIAAEAVDSSFVHAETIKTVKCCGKEMRSSSFKCVVCSVLAVAVAGITIPTVIHFDTSKKVIEAVKNNSQEPMRGSISIFLNWLKSFSDVEEINNPSSPQSQALEWLLSDDNEHVRSDQKYGDILNDNDHAAILRERYALAVMYYSMGGKDWAKLENFMSWDHQCNWNRIECNDESMRVTSIRLGNNSIHGTIPSEIQHLPNLQQLGLENNPHLSGVVPEELGRLLKLHALNFQNTNVTGSIDILCQLNSDLICSLEQEDSLCGFMADLENVDCSCCN